MAPSHAGSEYQLKLRPADLSAVLESLSENFEFKVYGPNGAEANPVASSVFLVQLSYRQ